MTSLLLLGKILAISTAAHANNYDFQFEPAAAGSSPSVSAAAQSVAAPEPTSLRPAHWRLSLGAARAIFYDRPGYRHGSAREERLRPSLTLTYYSWPRLATSLHLGRFAGLELERHFLDVSRRGGQPLLAFTFAGLKDMVGYTIDDHTLGAALVRAFSAAFTGREPELTRLTKPLNLYAGVQSGINFRRDLALVASYRVGLIIRQGRRPMFGQVGASYYF